MVAYSGDADNEAVATPCGASGQTAVVFPGSGNHYWLLGSDGGIFSYGGATFLGSAAALKLSKPIAAMAATPDYLGYWLVATDGGVFIYGDAASFGSAASVKLNQPIVGIAGTPDRRGYWLVAADGGIFAYGDAGFYGSPASVRGAKTTVGMAPTPDGKGYWVVGTDGGVFAYGDAAFYGSTGSVRLNSPVVGLAPSSTGKGYWLRAADGGVFAYGDASFRVGGRHAPEREGDRSHRRMSVSDCAGPVGGPWALACRAPRQGAERPAGRPAHRRDVAVHLCAWPQLAGPLPPAAPRCRDPGGRCAGGVGVAGEPGSGGARTPRRRPPGASGIADPALLSTV